MSLGFTTTLAPPLPSFSSTVQVGDLKSVSLSASGIHHPLSFQSANTQAQVKVSEVRGAISDNPVPLQSPFPPYPPHPLLFGNHMPVPENMPHPPIPNPGNFQMNGDNPLMSTMENWENWRQFQQAAWAHNLDPHMLAFYHNAGYSMDFANGPRRKNATRETTSMLKAWLNEHKKNPYPTKGEKIMLAIITKMSLTQVSTWFANARRRLKKENKMTWSPRNRAEEDRDHNAPSSTHSGHNSDDEDEEGNSSAIGLPGVEPAIDIDDVSNDEDDDVTHRISPGHDSDSGIKTTTDIDPASPSDSSKETKPKIWSLVDLARKEPRPDSGALTPTPLSPSLIPSGMTQFGGPGGPHCLGPLPPHHPGGAFPTGHMLPPTSGIFPSAVAAAAVVNGNKAFLPPPPASAAAAAAAYIQAHPFFYPHYPSIGIHPFSAFTRPAFGPLDAREPPKLTPEVLLNMEKEMPNLESRTEPSQFNTSKP